MILSYHGRNYMILSQLYKYFLLRKNIFVYKIVQKRVLYSLEYKRQTPYFSWAKITVLVSILISDD